MTIIAVLVGILVGTYLVLALADRTLLGGRLDPGRRGRTSMENRASQAAR